MLHYSIDDFDGFLLTGCSFSLLALLKLAAYYLLRTGLETGNVLPLLWDFWAYLLLEHICLGVLLFIPGRRSVPQQVS